MQTGFVLQPLSLTPNEQRAHDLAVVHARHYRASEVDLITSIEQVDRLRLFDKFCLESTHAYCRQILKLSDGVASNFICVAKKCRTVDGLKPAIASGDICVSAARKICPVINAGNQHEWIAKAKNLSVAEIEREVAKVIPQAAKKDHVKPVGPDRNRVAFEASDEFLSLRNRVQDLESQRLGRRATVAEVELAMAKAYLEKNDPVRKAERAENRKAPEFKPSEPKPSADKRYVPAAVEHAVRRRDRGECQVTVNGKKCGSTKFVHLHHRVEVARGGEHTLENIVTVCSAHHRQIHDDREFTV